MDFVGKTPNLVTSQAIVVHNIVGRPLERVGNLEYAL